MLTSLRSLLIAIFFSVLLLVIYSPVIRPNFAYLNDFTAFVPETFGFPETLSVMALGRPIQAVLENLQFRLIDSMASMQAMRIGLVVLTVLLMNLFALHFRKTTRLSGLESYLLAFLIMTLPSASISAFYVAQSVPGIIPLFLVLLAHLLIQKDGAKRGWFTLGASVVLVLSLATYPPVTFMFLTLTFISFVFGKRTEDLKIERIYREIGALFGSCVFYFAFIRFVYKPLFVGFAVGDTNYVFELTFSLATKLKQALNIFALDFAAWLPPIGGPLSATIGVILFAALCIATGSSPYLAQFTKSERLVVGAGVAFAIPILTISPVLMAQGDYPILYRISLPSAAATVPVAMIFIFRSISLKPLMAASIFALAIACTYLTASQVAAFMRLDLQTTRLRKEFEHIKLSINEPVENGSEIRVSPISPLSDPWGFIVLDYAYTTVNSSPRDMAIAAFRLEGKSLGPRRVIYDPTLPVR